MGYEKCPDSNPSCKYYSRGKGCYSDSHHEYWPKNEYTTKLEKDFRAAFVVRICRAEHDEIHIGEPPLKPSVAEMREALDGTA